MSIEFDASGLEAAKKVIEKYPQKAPQAISSSINRALIAGRKTLSVGIRSEYSIAAGTIKAHTKMKKASAGAPDGSMLISGHPIDLMEFSPRISGKGMVSVKVKKARRRLSHSFFVAPSAGLYHRIAEKRFPIKREYSLSVPQMAGNVNVASKVEERMRTVFEDRLQHALTYGEGGGYD